MSQTVAVPVNLAESLKLFRKNTLISTQEMAKIIETSRSTIWNIEHKRCKRIHIATLKRLQPFLTDLVMEVEKKPWYKNPGKLINVLLWLAIIVNALALIFLLVR